VQDLCRLGDQCIDGWVVWHDDRHEHLKCQGQRLGTATTDARTDSGQWPSPGESDAVGDELDLDCARALQLDLQHRGRIELWVQAVERVAPGTQVDDMFDLGAERALRHAVSAPVRMRFGKVFLA